MLNLFKRIKMSHQILLEGCFIVLKMMLLEELKNGLKLVLK